MLKIAADLVLAHLVRHELKRRMAVAAREEVDGFVHRQAPAPTLWAPCVQDLVEAVVPMHTIKAWIGHGSEKMVERYTHSRAEYHRRHLAKVPMVLPAAAETAAA